MIYPCKRFQTCNFSNLYPPPPIINDWALSFIVLAVIWCIFFLSLLFILVSTYKLAGSRFSLSTSVSRISNSHNVFETTTRRYITFMVISEQERLICISMLQNVFLVTDLYLVTNNLTNK